MGPIVKVDAFLTALMGLDGKPYQWCGKGPDVFDCSGAVTYALKVASLGSVDLLHTHNANALMGECKPTGRPGTATEVKPGCLAFYGPPGEARHVMVVAAPLPGEKWPFSVYGACGGDSTTKTLGDALLRDARVKHRSRITYRPDLIMIGRWKRLDYSKP